MPKVDRKKHIFKTKPHSGFEYTDVAHTKKQALAMVRNYPDEYKPLVHKPKPNSKDADSFPYHIYTLKRPYKGKEKW